MPIIDFTALKARISMLDTIALLGLELTDEGHGKYRGHCPVCEEKGGRSLAVTPSRDLFYCFNRKTGGDVISLTAHIKQLSVKDAAYYLADCLDKPTEKEKPGFPPAVCKATGIAYAKAAHLVDMVETHWKKPARIPIRDETGNILGYILVTEARLPTEWRLP